LAVLDRENHVREERPRVVEVVLRGPRRMIRMRMIEPEQLGAGLRGRLLRGSIVLRAHEEAAPRPLFRRVRQRPRGLDDPVAPDERAAAFVRIRLDAVGADRVGDAGPETQYPIHQFTPPTNDPSGGSSQKRSDRYLSPPSGKIITTTPLSIRSTSFRAAASTAPLEMPTSSPSSSASRFVSTYASSVRTRMSSSASVGS